MKNQIKTLVIVLGLGLANLANANTEPVVKAYSMNFYKVANSKEVKIFLNKVKGTVLVVSLKDENGNELYTEKLMKNEETYRTKLDMSALKSGIYRLEIKDGNNTEVNTIQLESESNKTRVLTLK